MNEKIKMQLSIAMQKSAIERLECANGMCKQLLTFACEIDGRNSVLESIRLNNLSISDAKAALMLLEREYLML
jgi:hypothetical protein